MSAPTAPRQPAVPVLSATLDRIALRDPLFISDLHLSASGPRTLERFERFMREVAPGHAEIVVLGDLFEYWAGDDDDSEVARRVLAALRAATGRGVAAWLMHGNRDLLLGPAFARAAGATLLADPTLADVAGQPTLLAHGDTYCTRDVDYLRFRGLVRDPQWQRAFLAKPLAERRAFIGAARAQSEAGKRVKASAIMDVTPEAIVEAMLVAGVTRMVHGHTHRPAMHRVALDGVVGERHVLTDWDFDTDAETTPARGRGGYLAVQGGVLVPVPLP